MTPPGKYGVPQPPLPPPDHPPAIRNPPPPVQIEEPTSDRLLADDQTMESPARTAFEHLSADDASRRTPSKKSSVRSSSSVCRLFADDASLVPTISSDNFESTHLEHSGVDLTVTTPSATTSNSPSRYDRGPKNNTNKHRRQVNLEMPALPLQD